MPQETNLNVSPYFDDFDNNKNYYKVLFKPGYPIQARELTTLQSILQSQIEKFGNHIFKEGSVVIPGQLSYNGNFYSVQIENTYSGISLSSYLNSLKGKTIRGSVSGIRAKVIETLDSVASPTGNITLFVNYLSTNVDTGESVFSDAETLIVEQTISSSNSNSFISAETGFSNTISNNATSTGSAVILSSGVYYIRGYFVNVSDDILVLDPHSNSPSYKVGFNVLEDVVNSDEDETLTDNAQGFNNYAAPGADRFRIRVELTKKGLNEDDSENFIELIKLENGRLTKNVENPQYSVIKDELARRTYDESGDYYVRPFSISALDTLNDLKGNNGVFLNGQTTYNNNIPSDDLATYKLSPGKAYIRGYEVETIAPTYLDFEKTRTSKTIPDQTLNYVTGPTYSLNRVYGSPAIGINTNYTLSLRDRRVGSSQITAAGKEIGIARVYDFALETGGYNTNNLDLNTWDISLFDIQTYTDITFNVPTTLTVPTHIKGKSSGATGYLRYSTTNSGIATFYNVQGTFSPGEKFIFNGTEDLSRVGTAVTSYGTGDVKSLYGIVGTAYTFTADVIQKTNYSVGLVNITAENAGISTVSTSSLRFTGIATVGNLVSYSTPGLDVPSYATITSVGERTLKIAPLTVSVPGICTGSLPASQIQPSDFAILSSQFLPSSDNTLYTSLPKTNISSVDLTKSTLSIRRQYDVQINNNETSPVSCNADEKFASFDEERYVLIREDGVIEPLSEDKVKISRTSVPEVLTIVGLSTSISTRAKLIVTLEKSKVKSKVKNKNRVKSIILDKSKLSQSGIGTTTLNDGLTYGLFPYGTRIQDEEICLLTSDVTKIHGIFESNDTSNPDLPSLTLESIQSNNSSTNDFVKGEEFVGSQSQSVAILVDNPNSATVSFVYLNDNRFVVGETIQFKESGASATISLVNVGDANITNNYIFENGQKNTIYDYSKIIRKRGVNPPTRKINIIFEYSSFSTSDDGDLITKNSYDSYDYSEIPSINGIRNSDIIDIRPSVSDFTVTAGSRSPFEFLGRSFTTSGNSVPNILASDEAINLSFSFYLPRVDRIYVSKSGIFQISKGQPSENPELPKAVDDAIEIATAYLPAYIYNINDIKFNVLQYKRYTMKDINKLENRIENLEYYTTLSLLETKTSNLTIKDAQGLDRFKSGFFVDNFETTEKQKRVTVVKNSIDVKNSELRPSHYTNSLDLSFGDFEGSLTDLNYNPDIQGSNVTKVGRIITLNYSQNPLIRQPYGTRVENVTPYLVTFYTGTIELNPASDTWVDTVRLNANTVVTENYVEAQTQLTRQEFDAQSGFGQVTWNSWNTVWTGNEVVRTDGNRFVRGNEIIQQTNVTSTQVGTSTRTGTSTRIVREIVGSVSFGDRTLSSSVIPFMRSRNIEFIGKRFKPYTRLYTFFDGVDVNQYSFPKLIEIQMTSGTFRVGETVIGTVQNPNVNSPLIRFRVAQLNHREGPYNRPTDFYDVNPYDTNSLPAAYSSTSNIINVDLFTLSLQTSGDFYGWVVPGMNFVGQTSGARATVSRVRIVTDGTGFVNGSFFIPNPNLSIHPKFEAGTKVFKLTNNPTNNSVEGIADTSSEEKYFSQGKIDTVQENIISIRNVRRETATITETRTERGASNTVVVENVVGIIPPPPPPPPPPVEPTGNLICPNGRGVYLDLRGIPSTQTVSVTLTVVDNESGIFHEINIPEVGVIRENDGPRTFELRGGRAYGPCTAPRGTTYAGNERIGNIRNSGSRPDTELVVEEGGDDWNDMVISTNVGSFRRCVDAPAPPPPPPPFRPDPLAQSFFISEPTGVFVTSLDLFFQDKDDTLPVTVQLRSMSLGTPTEIVYPFSEVVLRPDQVLVSDDASIPTRVTFQSPIYLAGNQEHAVVLLSNSTEYKVWISRLGEPDVSSTVLPGSQQTIVTKQPTLGSLFKSQNASTWTPSQFDDLKFNLYNAIFTNGGTINFYNPNLSIGNKQIVNLVPNPLDVSSRNVRVGLGTTLTDSGLTIGNTIIQQNNNARGTYVGAAGSATGTLLVTNSGIGYTPSSSAFTYNNISLVSLTGTGRNATANIHINNGVAVAATISNGGVGYQVGDVLTISGLSTNSPGRNMQLTVQSTTGNNELILDNVQGEFLVGAGYTVQYINNSGINTDLNGTGANVLLLDPPQVITDGLHIKVNHKNHGMHSDLNKVVISGVSPDLRSTKTLSVTNGTNDIVIENTSIGNFATFENVSVSSTNPGYALIENEIISYTGVVQGSPGTLTGITRSIDQSNQAGINYPVNTTITKYEFNGVSLRRINKTHDLVDVDDNVISEPIGLDYYHIKINTSTSGRDRSTSSTGLPKLYFNETKSSGSNGVFATQNVQFEAITPVVQTMNVSGTTISASVRTVTSTSIGGNEVSFLDNGFEDINLNSTNYFNTPRMVCSKVNENARLTTLPNNKSFTLNLNLSTSNPLLTPVIDLDRVSMIFTTNRVNSVVQDYITDNRVATLDDDPTAFVYATEVISLENPASSIKIITSAHVNVYSDVRAFYALLNDPSDELIYYPFPGYSNKLISGEIIDIRNSDGTSDSFVSKTDKIGFESSNIEFKDYEFTIDNLSPFRYFSVKLVGTSTNQAYPPRYRDLRVIALA